MFDHLSIGVSDLGRSRKFYAAALQALGHACLSDGDDTLGFGNQSPAFWLYKTDAPVPADPRSGLHICFNAPSRAAIDAFHAAALQTGGGDNGAPGLRLDYGPTYYAAFVTDPDGYRLEACYLGA